MENKNGSGLGDWLFLIVGAAIMLGVLAYDNQSTVMAYIDTIQSISQPQQTVEAGIGGILIDHWGLILLVVSVAFAAFKMWRDGSGESVQQDDGNTAGYESHKYVDVKIVR